MPDKAAPAGKVDMPHQAKANLSALIESTEDLIWSVDLDYRLIAFNQAVRQNIWDTLGVRLEAGMRLHELLPPDRAALWLTFFERILREGPFRVEYSLILPRILELSFSPIVSDGETTGISVFGKDITKRKAAECALKEAEEKYRAIFDGALEGIFRTSLDGKPLAANPAIARILGYDSPQEPLSLVNDVRRDVWFDPEERSRYQKLVKEQGAGPVLGYDCRLKRKDGSVVWVSLNARIVGAPDGTPLYNEGFLIDITERRQAEELLRQSGAFLNEAQLLGSLGCYVLDIPSGVWTCSEAMDEIFGIDREYDHSVAGWTALIHPHERAMMADYFQYEVVGQRKDFDKEYRIVRRSDHAERWVHGTGRLEFSAQGLPLKMHGVIKDITDRKLAEMQLRDSEASYRSTFEQAAVGIVHATFEGLILHYNTRFAAILGYAAGELYGLNVQQITAPEDRAVSLEAMQRILDGATDKESLEKRYLRKDGSPVWVKMTISLQRDAEDRALRFIAVVEDINDRKDAEQRLARAMEALRLSEAHYRTVFQTTPDSVIIVRVADGTIIDANQAFLDSTGYKRREVIGHTPLDLRIWVDPSDIQKLLDSLNRTGECRELEVRSRRKNGEIFWMRLSASLIEIGGVPCRITFARDVTEAKVTEERLTEAAHALRKSEAHYRTVFQTSVDGIAVSQMSDGRYVDANEAFLHLMGYERDEVIGRTSFELKLWADPEVRQEMVGKLREHSRFRGMQTRYVRKNGEIIWILVSATAIEIEGVPCILSVIQDISAAKVAEERLAEAANALRQSEERYRTVFLMNIDAVDICHLEDGRYIDVNDAFVACTGFQRDEVIGRTAFELGIWANPADRNQLVEIIRRDGSCRNMEAQYHTKDGTLRWALLSVSSIELDGIPCILSVTRDITEAKAAEKRLAAAAEALRVSEERYRATFQLSIDAININRLSDGVFVDVNEAFLQFMGVEREEVIGRTSQELDFWVDPEVRRQMIETLRHGASCRDLEARFRRKNGEIVWGQASESILEIDGVPCILSVTRDISAAKIAEEQIRDLAFYDTLTHLPNRRLLMERLRQSLAAGARTNRKRALLFVDLDNFKILNDTLGHQTGDLMLQEVAVRLAACVRESDTVARLGGDEFVVMLEELGDVPEEAAAQAESVCEKILAAIDKPFLLSGRECLSTCSIGITVFGNKRESTDEVLQQADIAMYQAKAAGRNTLRFFAPALQAAVNARAALEEDIRQAIKSSQFVLYYQPQLDSSGLFGAEALIRWNHPRRGLLFPGEFISLAEETGLIQPLGDWVLENACAQVAAWAGRADTANISVAVNISARQFRQSGFVDKVLASLARTGANPQNIKLELTESMLVENIEDVIAKMTLLKSHGLKFSLDDFGTGYSSLAYLKRLPLDQLKIDSSFVRDILADGGSRAIAQSVISLGHALGLSVIAECVETEEQHALLSRLGCNAFQGFLFSRPLPLDAFEKQWLGSSEYKVPIAG